MSDHRSSPSGEIIETVHSESSSAPTIDRVFLEGDNMKRDEPRCRLSACS